MINYRNLIKQVLQFVCMGGKNRRMKYFAEYLYESLGKPSNSALEEGKKSICLTKWLWNLQFFKKFKLLNRIAIKFSFFIFYFFYYLYFITIKRMKSCISIVCILKPNKNIVSLYWIYYFWNYFRNIEIHIL